MCWSATVSLIFSGIYFFCNVYYIFRKPPYWREYLIFGCFYTVMELYQCFQWLYGNVYGRTVFGVSNCDRVNMSFTLVGHILIWLQPLLFSYIGYRTARNKKFFKIANMLNIIVLLYSLSSLYRGFYKNDYYTIQDSVYGNSTCTDTGLTGHLLWRFKPVNIELFPNYFTYLTLCILSFCMYEQWDTRIIGVGWLAALSATKFLLQPHVTEMASSWCLFSIVANLIILTFSNYRQYQISKLLKTNFIY